MDDVSKLTNVRPGRFIVIEGPDLSGKTYLVNQLRDWVLKLPEDHPLRRTVFTREPGGTPFAEAIRNTLLNVRGSTHAQLLGFLAARQDHMDTFIRPLLEQGHDVVCDRFFVSTLAYQVYPMGGKKSHVTSLVVRGLHKQLTPTHTIVLDPSDQLVALRYKQRSGRDVMEQQVQERGVSLREAFRWARIQMATYSREPLWKFDVLPINPDNEWAVFDTVLRLLDWRF